MQYQSCECSFAYYRDRRKAPDIVEPVEVAEETRPGKELKRQTEKSSKESK